MRQSISLSERTAARLRERIRTRHKPGDCLPSLKELCAELGVSINTLRAAMALLEHDGRVQTRHGAGVFVQAAAARLRIGVLSELDLLTPVCAYHRNLAHHVMLTLRERGMIPTLFCGTVQPGEGSEVPTCPEFWEPETQRRLDGAVIVDAPCNDPWYFRIRNMTLPAAGEFTGFEIAGGDILSVAPGLRELARQGCCRIALLTASPVRTVPPFEQGLAVLGLAADPRWIHGEFNAALPGAGWEEFREIWSSGPEKPDGLLVTDDVLFRSAAQAICELGVDVPGQLRIATLAVRQTEAPLPPIAHTRIEFDTEITARSLVDLLERRLKGERPPDVPSETPYAVVQADGMASGWPKGGRGGTANKIRG